MINKGIYKIINLVNNKYYVGSSINLKERYLDHMQSLRANKHHCTHLQNAWNKYGEKNFRWEIIELLNDVEEIKIREIEQKYIDADFDNQYNIARNVNAPGFYSEEIRQKQVNACRKIIRSNNKTGYSGINYKTKEKYYACSIQIWGIRIYLGTFEELEQAIKIRKEAEEYFWQSYIEELPKHLKQLVIKQYKESYNYIKTTSNIKGITYCKDKDYSVYIDIKNYKKILLTSCLPKLEAIKIKIKAENYFCGEYFLSLDLKDKKEAIKEYKKTLFDSRLKSGYENITQNDSGGWALNIKIGTKRVYLGSFRDINKALEYRQKALDYFQSSKFLNNSLEIKEQLITNYKKKFYEENNLINERGITYVKEKNIWRAFISIKGKTKWLGQYPTKEMALQARKDGELKYKNNN